MTYKTYEIILYTGGVIVLNSTDKPVAAFKQVQQAKDFIDATSKLSDGAR